MSLISSCSCLCAIYWSQVLSPEWRCSWSSADRWCSNYILMLNNFIAYCQISVIHQTLPTQLKGQTPLTCIQIKENISTKYKCANLRQCLNQHMELAMYSNLHQWLNKHMELAMYSNLHQWLNQHMELAMYSNLHQWINQHMELAMYSNLHQWLNQHMELAMYSNLHQWLNQHMELTMYSNLHQWLNQHMELAMYSNLHQWLNQHMELAMYSNLHQWINQHMELAMYSNLHQWLNQHMELAMYSISNWNVYQAWNYVSVCKKISPPPHAVHVVLLLFTNLLSSLSGHWNLIKCSLISIRWLCDSN